MAATLAAGSLTEREFFAYLAGVIDSDGSIMLLKHKDGGTKRGFAWQPRITIANTNREFLVFIKDRIGGRISKGRKNIGSFKGKKKIYQLTMEATLIREIIDELIGFLVAKKNQAKFLNEAINITKNHKNKDYDLSIVDSKMETIYNKIKELNK